MSDVERRKLSQARVADLRAELEKRGLDKTGIKAVLVERLVAALTSDGLSNSEIDDYVVEAANDSSNKRQPKRGVTPSKSKVSCATEEDEIMGDLDDKSEVLDYGDTEELEKGDEAENTKDGAEESAADTRSGGDDFQVLDEEAFENDAEEKEEQQESALEHDDSIDLGLNEDMLIEEEVNSFGAESDASAALSHNKKSHQQDKGRKNQSEKEESSLKSDKQHHQDSSSTGGSGGGSGDVNSRQSEKKSSSSPRQESERSSKSVAEKAPSSESNQQQQHTEQDGVNGDKSRSCGSPKDRSKNSSEEKRESSPSAANSSGRNLWVSGLSSSTRATDLKQTFSKYGKVLGAKVVTNARTPGARCYGFVTMAKKEDALRCIQYLDRTELHGRMISVEKARGEATGPGRVKTPSPTSKKEGKTEERESEPKKESKSSGDHKKEDRRDSREKTGSKPVRQRITAPSPGPSPSERSDSRSDQRSEQGKKRLRSPSPRRPVPPRRVNHSPGGGLHTRRSTSVTTPVLTFASIKQARERQRLREREREDREHARRREEEARRNERRQREEQLRLEREKEELRKERERIEQARKDILRLEREKARLERERLEWEREELQRQQQKLRELAERPPPVVVASHPVPAAPVSSRSWSASNSYSGVSQPESRYVDARRSSSSAVPNKRQGSHHTADYYEERSAKRPAPSSDDRRVGYDTAVAPPPPRFNTMQSSTSSMKRPSRDHEYPHRSSSSSFERSSTNIASNSVPYDRSSSSTSARRDAYFPSSSSSGANRVVEPTRREAEPSSRGKDDRYRDSYRPPGRDNDRAMASRGTGDIDLRGPPPSSSSSSSRPRRYPDVVASGISASSGSSRDPWLSRKSDSSGSGGWNRGTETSSGNRWSSTNVSSRGSTAIYGSSLPAIGISMGSMAGAPATSSSLYASSERFDAYKTNLQNLRKY